MQTISKPVKSVTPEILTYDQLAMQDLVHMADTVRGGQHLDQLSILVENNHNTTIAAVCRVGAEVSVVREHMGCIEYNTFKTSEDISTISDTVFDLNIQVGTLATDMNKCGDLINKNIHDTTALIDVTSAEIKHIVATTTDEIKDDVNDTTAAIKATLSDMKVKLDKAASINRTRSKSRMFMVAYVTIIMILGFVCSVIVSVVSPPAHKNLHVTLLWIGAIAILVCSYFVVEVCKPVRVFIRTYFVT